MARCAVEALRAGVTLLLIWIGGVAAADSGCLRPVEGGQFDIKAGGVPEMCIATATYATIPGYPKLIIQRDACRLQTIEGERLVALEADYPHSALWAYRDFDVAEDGTVYGYGGTFPSRIYRLRPGEDRFSPLPIDRHLGADYDARSDRILLRFEDMPLQEWSAEGGVQPSPLAGLDYGTDDVLPQYFEAVKGYLSFSQGRLFWRAETGGDWQWVQLGWLDRHRPDDLWMLKPRRAYLDAAAGLFALQFSSDVLVFAIDEGGAPDFLYSVGEVRDVFQAGDGPIVALTGQRHVTQTHPEHVVHVIEREGPRRVLAGEAVQGASAETLVIARNGVTAQGYAMPPLFLISGRWVFFDGRSFLSAPELGEQHVGHFPRWTHWGGRLFLLDPNGWGEVQGDLSVVPGEWPLSYRNPSEVNVQVSEALEGILAVGRDPGLWISRDGLNFGQVETGDVTVRRYLADLPVGAAGVLLAEDGLYLLDQDCAEAAMPE